MSRRGTERSSGMGRTCGLRTLTILAIAGTLQACGVYGPPVRSHPEDAQTVEQRDEQYEADVIRDSPSAGGDPGLGLPPDLGTRPETVDSKDDAVDSTDQAD